MAFRKSPTRKLSPAFEADDASDAAIITRPGEGRTEALGTSDGSSAHEGVYYTLLGAGSREPVELCFE